MSVFQQLARLLVGVLLVGVLLAVLLLVLLDRVLTSEIAEFAQRVAVVGRVRLCREAGFSFRSRNVVPLVFVVELTRISRRLV